MRTTLAQRARGAARAAAKRLLNRIDAPVLVLIYHRVTTLTHDPQLLAVAPEHFRDQLRFLKRRYPLVRFDADWSAVAEPSVAITFDDGYADNALEALPIIEEVGVPVTFFISTGYVGTEREFWWDELERLILGAAARPETFVLRDQNFGTRWPTRTEAERSSLYRELHPLMKQVDHLHRETWLNQVRQWAGPAEQGRERCRPLSRAELLRLAASTWATIGAHTVWHTRLSVLSPERQEEEILGSKNDLAAWTGKDITVFSYPFGGQCDYNRDSLRICRKAGFIRAAANRSGQAHRWTDPCQVPRHLVRNWPLELFRENLQSFWLQ